MMKAVDNTLVGEEQKELTTESAQGAQSTENTERAGKKGPKLTAEQSEWLKKVFIPNFRAELLRTLRPEDLVGGKRGKRAGKADAGREEKAGKASEGRDAAALAQAKAKVAERVPELEGEVRRLRAVVAETRVDRELVWAAASHHAVNPGQVAQLMKDRIELNNELDPIVINAQGDRAIDRYGRPVAVADAVRTFLDENPHLVRASTELAGGGSGGTDATVMARRVAAVTGGDLIEEALREGE